jgi:hypothetical protein
MAKPKDQDPGDAGLVFAVHNTHDTGDLARLIDRALRMPGRLIDRSSPSSFRDGLQVQRD